ncbi:MAG: hypothetical protein CVV39_01330 [Planctomycetes bacterium HGW-Planctomycetes-1]|nr:MAG: hypothetical protein CVV39_01330 [Planctomycetes bacterium HGW-Planctomycetes-1]
MDIEKIKAVEKQFHEIYRDGSGPLEPVNVEQVRSTILSPCYENGNDRYSDNKKAFHDLILHDGGWRDKKVLLDYACGNGVWAIYFALTGTEKVIGFDIAESGIRRGNERVQSHGLADKVKLLTMDASKLEFPDNTFDMVIGTAVLHHVIKYPGVFEELYRVMKPGAKAYFLEGLADFPLWKLWWKIKGEVPSGDVPIFSKVIRGKAHMFSKIEITGDTFLFSAKTFLWKKNCGLLRKFILKILKRSDDFLFKICPFLRRWGSFSYIVFTK